MYPATGNIFLFYFLLLFVQEFLSNIFLIQRKNNLFLYHLCIPFQLLILCWYFTKLIKRSRTFIMSLSILAGIAMLLLSSFYENLSQYFSFSSIIKNLIISALVLVYFRQVLIKEVNSIEEIDENIWICTGLFINSLGSFFIEGFMNYYMKYERNFATNLFYLDVGLYFIFYITFILAIALKRSNVLKIIDK